MSTMKRVLRGGASSSYPPEFQLQLEDWKFAKVATEEVADSCTEITKDYTAANGLNRYEKLADCFAAYSVKMTDTSARDAISPMKTGLEQIGRLYRQFGKDVHENVVSKLQAFLQSDYKKMTEEVSKLNRARTSYDNAADAFRRKPNDAETEQKKNTAEALHETQLNATKECLAGLDDFWEMMDECLKKFDELFFQLLADEKEETEKLIAANRF